MTRYYKTLKAAKCEATRQTNKYGLKVIVHGNARDGYSVELSHTNH